MSRRKRTILTCDRCGLEDDESSAWSQASTWKPHDSAEAPNWDLCPDCARALDRWFDQGKPEVKPRVASA